MCIDEQSIIVYMMLHVADSMYYIVCCVECQPLALPLLLVLRHLVAHADAVAVPAAPGVGEVEGVGKVGVEHRLIVYTLGMYIVLFPNVLTIVW